MKLVTYELPTPVGRVRRIGAVEGDHVVDLNFAVAFRLAHKGEPRPYAVADALVAPDMIAFLEGGDSALAHARGAVEQVMEEMRRGRTPVGSRGETLVHARNAVRLLAPIPRPVLLRDYYTFEQHVTTMFKKRNDVVPPAWYEIPVHHKQNPASVIGPDAEIAWPSFTEKFDYELEIAAVIGRTGRDVSAANAAGYIAGYCIMNDFSARDMQRTEMACRMGPAKGKDFGTALGPWIVTADELPDPYHLHMQARVNGEVWSDNRSDTMQHSFESMVVFTSRDETISAGEVWGSGTVGGGCGAELDRWLKPGDVMELEIEGIGVLRNRVVRPDRC